VLKISYVTLYTL